MHLNYPVQDGHGIRVRLQRVSLPVSLNDSWCLQVFLTAFSLFVETVLWDQAGFCKSQWNTQTLLWFQLSLYHHPLHVIHANIPQCLLANITVVFILIHHPILNLFDLFHFFSEELKGCCIGASFVHLFANVDSSCVAWSTVLLPYLPLPSLPGLSRGT